MEYSPSYFNKFNGVSSLYYRVNIVHVLRKQRYQIFWAQNLKLGVWKWRQVPIMITYGYLHTWPRSRSNACVLRSRSERERNRRDFEIWNERERSERERIDYVNARVHLRSFCVQFSRNFLANVLIFVVIFINLLWKKVFKKKIYHR